MSEDCAGLPSSFDRFSAVWDCDFEFRPDSRHLPVPVAMFAKEHRTGTEISMRRDQLLTCRSAPFDVGPNVLFTSYTVVAELSCFAVLGWPMPRNIICTYFETCAAINGLDIVGLEKKRPTLIEACDLFGIPHTMTAEHKNHMRDLILGRADYSEEEWQAIGTYNKDDVLQTMPLFRTLAPRIDVQVALFRGRYARAIVAMETNGLPIDGVYLDALATRWQALRLYYIHRDDRLRLYDGNGSFCEDRMEALIRGRGWDTTWPRTATGKFELKSATIGKQAKKHPELRALQRLRDQVAELRLGKFLNTVGADASSRIATMPFWTRSGRNQPSGRDRVFLLSLPSWIHGLIKPPPGWGVAALDWQAQEIGLVAGLSQDPARIADYLAGDPHAHFAVRAGLAPEGAVTKSLRDTVKPISLGSSYGISKYGVAAQTGKSLIWASDKLALHRHAYPVFCQWQQNVVTQALFDERIVSPLGWPMAVHAETRHRTLLNYPAQAAGADCLRLAVTAGHEAGIHICAPAHDALWIAAPLAELDDAIATMASLMIRASNAVCGIDIRVDVKVRIPWPYCLGDVREPDAKGQAMWMEIAGLIYGDALRQGAMP
jgi:hypothetical protein